MSIFDAPKHEEIKTLEGMQDWIQSELIDGTEYLLREWYAELPEKKAVLIRNIAAIAALATIRSMESDDVIVTAACAEVAYRMVNCAYHIGKADGQDEGE